MDYTFPWEVVSLAGAGHFIAPERVSLRVVRTLRARRPLWRFLSRFARETAPRGGTTWLVGGIVRDLVDGKPGNDVDLMVTGLGFEDLGRTLRALPASRLGIRRIVAVGKHFPVYKVKAAWAAEDVDVAPARSGTETGGGPAPPEISGDAHWAAARADARRRDLTINALMVRLWPVKGRLAAEVVDFFGGLDDLRRRIRGVADPEARLREDPLRILRAIRQKNERTGYAFDPRTWSAIRRIAPERLAAVPGDRVATELVRALAINPAGALDDLARAGILALLIPEWRKLPPGAVARTKRRIALLRRSIDAPPEAALLFAALLADLAEAECRNRLRARKEAPPLPGAAGHGSRRTDRDGFARLPGTEAVARRLRLPQLRRIVWLLEDLVRLGNIRLMANPNARIEAIFGRWKKREELLALYGAAQRAAGRRVRDFRVVLRRAARRPPLISGSDLLSAGVPEGAAIKSMLESVREATITGRVRSKIGAITLARSLLSRQRKSR